MFCLWIDIFINKYFKIILDCQKFFIKNLYSNGFDFIYYYIIYFLIIALFTKSLP